MLCPHIKVSCSTGRTNHTCRAVTPSAAAASMSALLPFGAHVSGTAPAASRARIAATATVLRPSPEHASSSAFSTSPREPAAATSMGDWPRLFFTRQLAGQVYSREGTQGAVC